VSPAWLAVALCAAAVAALLAAERRGSRAGVWVAKPLAAAAFLWAALARGALDTRYGRLVLLALALCALGDVLLIPRERPAVFRAGIFAFLSGHLAYLAAFAALPLAVPALLVALAAAAGGWALALRWLGPHLPPGMRGPVRVYVAVLLAMAATAVAASAAGGPLAASVGAIGFALSDLAVARERFVARGFVNKAWGLPLYFGAQLVLASTV
jgi:uncharacterized membrane protein YhhN